MLFCLQGVEVSSSSLSTISHGHAAITPCRRVLTIEITASLIPQFPADPSLAPILFPTSQTLRLAASTAPALGALLSNHFPCCPQRIHDSILLVSMGRTSGEHAET